MVLVPRVLEMFREGLVAAAEKEKPFKRRLFFSALGAGTRAVEAVQHGATCPIGLRLRWWLADRLVFSAIRARLGLDRLKVFFSGGAPLSPRTAKFFAAIRLPVMEGYGLSETSPLVTVNPLSRLKFGTVGLPVPGVEVRIDEDGEILVRGPNVMLGYLNKPVETAEVIDAEGWFHTGDVGELGQDGYLRITDRKKALLVLANGKKVAAQQIESRLAESPYITQAFVVGDHKSTVGALVVPELVHLREWARGQGLPAGDGDDRTLVSDVSVQRFIQTEIQNVSDGLADYEKVRRFILLDHDFRIEDGELTPTLKVRRKVVLEKYREAIEGMYGAGEG
jgi:long-chain acyl-CoA synthetase